MVLQDSLFILTGLYNTFSASADFCMSMKSSSCEKPNGNLMFIYHSMECSKRGINYKWGLAGGGLGGYPQKFLKINPSFLQSGDILW